ncbi:MAG: DUF4279 domain-containing protein [Defluviitaleaceae bacterium]|nr:DUF4279 domain-containing protein [Defluviitaleaceae bacterium]
MDTTITMNEEHGYCCLQIYGDNICFTEIEKELGLKASHTAEKGKHLVSSYGTITSRICRDNGWFYVVEFNSRYDFLNSLGSLLLTIYPQKDKLRLLAEKFEGTDIFISISVCSDYAQMSFEINPELQKLIAEMGFPLHFSILSFGMVDP